MSEYVDYFALQSEARTLEDLRGQIASVVDDAYVIALPLDPTLRFPMHEGRTAELAQDIWHDLPKPAWVVISAPDPDRDINFPALANLGPTVLILGVTDEAWKVSVQCGGVAWQAVLSDVGWVDRFRPIVDNALLFAGSNGSSPHDRDRVALCLGTDPTAFSETMTMDGGTAFLALTGIPDIYLFDQSVFYVQPPHSGVVFDFEHFEF